MKKVIFMLVAAFCVVTASAQDHFKAGDATLSGKLTGLDFVIGIPDGGGDNVSSVNFGIDGSYFVIDKLAVTAGFGLYSSSSDYVPTIFNFSIGARYYVWDAVFAGIAFGGEKYEDVDLMSFIGVQAGYTYYLSDKVFFEPALFFQKGLSDLNKDSAFGLSIGIGINF